MAAIRGLSLAKINKIIVEFSCFDEGVTSAREFLRRISSSCIRETNPKCEVSSVIKGDYSPPYIGITFNDGSHMQFDPQNHDVLNMIAMINKKTRNIYFHKLQPNVM